MLINSFHNIDQGIKPVLRSSALMFSDQSGIYMTGGIMEWLE